MKNMTECSRMGHGHKIPSGKESMRMVGARKIESEVWFIKELSLANGKMQAKKGETPMVDKEKQFVGGDKFPNYSRAEIEEAYHKEFTDEQWEMIVDYAHNADDEDEYDDNLTYAVYNTEELQKTLKAYEEVWLEVHGNPYPFDKDGNNTQEDN